VEAAVTYGTDPGSGGTPPYGPSPSYDEPSRPRGRPVWWTLAGLVAVAAILFGVYSCSGGDSPDTRPPDAYPTTTPSPPSTPYSTVADPDEPPTDTPGTEPAPPTQVPAGSGGGADDGRGGGIGLVAVGLLLVGAASTVLVRRRRHSP
jgi:hypothetical protein